jgi:hypothetical protein
MKSRPRVVPPAPDPERTGDDGLVEIRRCNAHEAIVLKGLLESERIPTLLRSRILHSVHPFTVGAQGEVVIFVPKADASRAAGLLMRVV